MRVFLTIALLIWTAMHRYVFGRAKSVPVISRHVPGYVLVVLACCLWASYILRTFWIIFRVGLVARILETIGAEWFGITCLLLVVLLLVDVLTLFGWVWPRFAPVAIVAAVLLSLIAFVQGHRAPVIGKYEVSLPKLRPELMERWSSCFGFSSRYPAPERLAGSADPADGSRTDLDSLSLAA